MIGSERLRILPSDRPLVSVDTPGAMSRVACVVASLVTIRTLMVVAGALYVALGSWLALDVHLYYEDAVARTALASFVISGRDPHLASIGFVWNPVPSIVEVPLLVLLRPFGLQFLAGPLVSALFGALTVGALYSLCRKVGASERTALVYASVFAANPMIVLYSINGMSEMALLLPMVWSTQQLLTWLQTQRPGNLLLAAAGMGATVWVRYEAIPFVAAAVAGVIVFATFERSASWTIEKMEGVSLALLVPSVYSLFLWMFFNWQIMGDPLYFQRGEYSNAAWTTQSQANDSMREMGYHSLAVAIQFTMGRVIANAPLYIPLALIATIIAWRRRSPGIWLVLLISASVPAIHVLLLYQGSSFGWFRYFMYPIPYMFVMMAVARVEVENVLSDRRRHHTWRPTTCRWFGSIPSLMVVLLLISNAITFWGMMNPDIGKQDYAAVRKLFDPSYRSAPKQSFMADRTIAAYLDSHPGGLVLTDSYNAFAIILASRHPDQFVTTGDRNFQSVLAHPRNYVDRILIQSPTVQTLGADHINRAYPELYKSGAPWAVLEEDWNGVGEWRMYRLIRSSATVGS